MSRPARCILPVLLSLALGLPLLGAHVQPSGTAAGEKPVKVLKEWKGSSRDAKDDDAWKLAPPDGVVAGPRAWELLWQAWRLDKGLPGVDFEKELIVAKASPGPGTIDINGWTLNQKGDLQNAVGEGPKQAAAERAGPGFAFVIHKLDRAGIKSVQGAPIGVEPKKEAKTGFVVGGKNDTVLIKQLTEINGIPLAQLEKKMRPQALSKSGFLGEGEHLLTVLAADNVYVVETLKLTHQEVARHMLVLAARGNTDSFSYLGQDFKVEVSPTSNYIDSPFADGTKTNANVVIQNLANNKKLRFSLLVPLMIERYGFYEGRYTPYRVEPEQVVEVLGFLKRKG